MWLIPLFALLFSCRKDRPEPSWEVDVLAPLLLDTIFIGDVISDTLYTVEPDMLVSFVFEEKLYEAQFDSLVRLPDTLISWEFDLQYLPFPITLQPGDTIISEEFDWPLDIEDYNIDGIKLVEGWIRSGALVFEVLDQSESDLLCIFEIRSARNSMGETLYLEEKVLSEEWFSESYDIAGYRMDLTGENNDTVNMLSYSLSLIVHPDEPEEITLNPSDKFSVNLRFESIILDYVRGYFGQNTFTFGPSENPVSIFQDLNVQNISVHQPEVYLEIHNYFGMEAWFNILDLTAVNSQTSETVSLECPLVDSNLFINRAYEAAPGSGIVNPSFVTYDFSDSNFGDLMSIQPDKIIYSAGIETNIFGDSTDYTNFFYYDYPIEVYFESRINQGIQFEDLLVESTVDWNSSEVDLDNVSGGHLVLVYTNGFPFDLSLDLFLLDEEETILDTLITDGYIAGGILDEQLRVSQAVETRIALEVDDPLKEILKKAKFARYTISVNTVSNVHVLIYATDVMQLKIIGDFTYRIEQ